MKTCFLFLLLFARLTGAVHSAPIAPITPPAATPHFADPDGDGQTTVLDAILTTRFAMGDVWPTAMQEIACDINRDGYCDWTDTPRLLKLLVGSLKLAPAAKISQPVPVTWGDFSGLTEAPDGQLVILGQDLKIADPKTGATLSEIPLSPESRFAVSPAWRGSTLFALTADHQTILSWPDGVTKAPKPVLAFFSEPDPPSVLTDLGSAFGNVWVALEGITSFVVGYNPAEGGFIGGPNTIFRYFSRVSADIQVYRPLQQFPSKPPPLLFLLLRHGLWEEPNPGKRDLWPSKY